MSVKLDQSSVNRRAPEPIDGEIYVNLRSSRTGWRGVMLLGLMGLAFGTALFAGYSQISAVTNGGKFQKGATQCPGMSPAQRAAAAAKLP